MTIAVGVDFGTSSTCVTVAVGAEHARVVVIDGSPLMPSAVYADGHTVFVGAEAQRQAALDPSRYEPTPKRRIDEGSLLLGDTVLPVQRAIAAVLGRAVREARNTLGGKAVDVLMLTHPADWGAVRVALLVSAAQGLAASVRTMAEPVAAAVQQGASVPEGAVLAVLDVGAGTTDVSVLRAEDGDFQVLATRGDPHFGGADIDEALMDELGARLKGEQRPLWDAVARGQGLKDRRRRRALRVDVQGAKESLSRHSYADVPMPGELPHGHVTRPDLERLIQQRVTAVVEMLATALQDTGAVDAEGSCHAGVFLVGGSTRIPLFATMVHQRLGVLPVSTDQPETVVARGALRALMRAHRPLAVRAADVPASAPALTGSAAPPSASALPIRGRKRWWLAAAAVLVAGIVGATAFALAQVPAAPSTRVVVSQRASVTVPASWQEPRGTDTGEHAQLEFTPDGVAATDRGLFFVQTVLDATVTQQDVARALQSQVTVEQAAGKRYEAFDGAAQFADRVVIRYREIRRDAAVVDWYVLVPIPRSAWGASILRTTPRWFPARASRPCGRREWPIAEGTCCRFEP